MLIYVDLSVAFPVALLALAIVSLAFIAEGSTTTGASAPAANALGIYSQSQLLVSAMIDTNPNYSQAISISNAFSREYNATVRIVPYSGNEVCAYDICRIITLSGKLYLLGMQ